MPGITNPLTVYLERLTDELGNIIGVSLGGPSHDETIAHVDGLALVSLEEQRHFSFLVFGGCSVEWIWLRVKKESKLLKNRYLKRHTILLVEPGAVPDDVRMVSH